MSATAEIGPAPELAWVEIDRLTVDRAYQRAITGAASRRIVKNIAEGFDWALFQVVTVARDGDGFKVIDGQHRVEAAKLRGVARVPALVVEGADTAQAARLFVACNRNRVPVEPLTLHRALRAAGDGWALQIDAVARAAGVRIAPYPIPANKIEPGMTLAIGTIGQMLRLHGAEAATAGLRIVGQVWAEPVGNIRADRIRGVTAAVAAHGAAAVERALDGDGRQAVEQAVRRRVDEEAAWEVIEWVIRRRIEAAAKTAEQAEWHAAAPAESSGMAALPAASGRCAATGCGNARQPGRDLCAAHIRERLLERRA